MKKDLNFIKVNKTNDSEEKIKLGEKSINNIFNIDFSLFYFPSIRLKFFNNYFRYNLLGGILKIQNKIIAISVGEIINDTLFIHIEKANRMFLGAYQMINNEFAKYYAKDVTYINREEDVGDDGLRKAKLMYNPIKILKKYIVEVKI